MMNKEDTTTVHGQSAAAPLLDKPVVGQKLDDFAMETKAKLESASQAISSMRQGVKDLQNVIDECTRLTESSDSQIHLPSHISSFVKDLAENQAKLAGSASDVFETMDAKLPDLDEGWKKIEERAAQLTERANALDKRARELNMRRITWFGGKEGDEACILLPETPQSNP